MSILKQRAIGWDRSNQKMGNENKSTRSIQRWCPSDYYYHHVAGIEGARRGRPCRVETTDASFLKLCTQLHLRWHLLEQPSSSVPSRETGQRRNSLGKS